MTEAEAEIIKAIARLELPADLINRAKLAILSRPEAREPLLQELADAARIQSGTNGEDLEVLVRGCVMQASLDLFGKLPPR